MRKMNIVVLACMLVLTSAIAPSLALAVEIAPRISDREIVEALTELKQQQKALNQRLTDLIHNIDKRFDANDRRFETMDRRFEAMMNWMLTLFGIVITLILGLLGYMIWDRRTVLKPLRTKITILEESSRQMAATTQRMEAESQKMNTQIELPPPVRFLTVWSQLCANLPKMIKR